MLIQIILISLFINWLLMLPVYQNIVYKLRLPSKPFNCEYCLTFWLCIILAISTQSASYLIIAVTAPVVTVLIKRAIEALPIKF